MGGPSPEVLVLDIELHLPFARSLKAKRSIVQSLVRTVDGWTGCGAAEVDHLDVWQRTRLLVSVVGRGAGHVEEVADRVERRIWSTADVEVVSIGRRWLDLDEVAMPGSLHGA